MSYQWLAVLPAAGKCIYCGCTPERACTLPNGDGCAWRDRLRICCTAPACLRAYAADQRAYERRVRAASRRRTPAEVHAAMMAERKDARRRARERAKHRKGRAA